MSKTQKLLRLALATFTTVAVVLMLAMPFTAGTASATVDNPETVEGNPTCGNFTAGGTEFKIEKSNSLGPTDSGQYTDGLLIVDLMIRQTDDGPVFDWTANFGVDVVVAKGGPKANVYRYSPIAIADTGLHAPMNTESGEWYGLSHISFCYFEKNATTTTTTTLETTSTESKTTSSTAAPTTTEGKKTTSTEALVTTTHAEVMPTQITATTAPATAPTTSSPNTTSTTLAGTLPFTGVSTPTLWILAVSLLGAGVTAMLIARREQE
jgi:hypothetical protein